MSEMVHIPFHGGESDDETHRIIEEERAHHRKRSEGFIYAIRFTTDIVKVGRTNNITQRLSDHTKSAQAHGAAVAQSWASGPHMRYRDNEFKLIEFCTDRWAVAGGKEYFRGADFDAIVAFAKSLPNARITDAEIAEAKAKAAAAPSLVAALCDAWDEIDRAAAAHDGPNCPWYEQFQKSRAWFEAEYPDGFAPALVGRHAWASLPGRHKPAALDIFFTDYWIRLQEEEEEDRLWRESGAYEAEIAEFRATLTDFPTTGGAS